MSKKWYNLFVSVEGESQAGDTGSSTAQSGVSAPAPTAAQTVAELAAMIGPEPTFAPPAQNPTSFDDIYRQAEITAPTHGYTILKIIDMLQSEHIRNLPADVKRSSILVALEAAGVSLKEVVEDAIRRDRAIDTYERVMQKSVEDFEVKKTEENRQLEQEMEKLVAEYRARMQANTEALTKRKEEFFGWRLQKQHEEKRIADAVGYFTNENPITVSSSSPSAIPKREGAVPPEVKK
jgi:hypothetical protein